MSSLPLASVEMPRWAKMSPILPMAWVRPPAATTRSRMVGSGGGMARSLRLAVRREGLRRLAEEGPGDDPADAQRVDDLGGDAADLVEALEAEMRLVRGDLQHAVGGGVEDRLAGADVLLAEGRRTGMPEEWALQRVPGRRARSISGPVTSGGIAGSVRGK